MTFHYRDPDGERLEIEADSFADGTPALYIDTTAPIRLRLDQVEDLVAGIRDTRRHAATPHPQAATPATDTAKDRWAQQLVAVLADLDRCAHGRHEGDPCVGAECDGTSRGNPYIGPDRVIGYSRYGRPLFLPARPLKHEPAAWHTAPTTKDHT
ncbi:hypothetical protein ACOZE4_18375 [Streptomyces griseoincarnatus]